MERREEIILAALDLASGSGLKSVSMAGIAKKVGIKTPSLYNHFRSKEEILKSMYSYLREKAQQHRPSGLTDPGDFASKSLEEILMESLSAYLGLITNRDMLRFFRVLYSERSVNPMAAEIMLQETEHMVRATRNLFYALAVHGKMKNESIDTAAVAFSMAVHSLVDCRMDRMTAGMAEQFGDDGKTYTKELADFVRWFSKQVGGDDREQETH